MSHDLHLRLIVTRDRSLLSQNSFWNGVFWSCHHQCTRHIPTNKNDVGEHASTGWLRNSPASDEELHVRPRDGRKCHIPHDRVVHGLDGRLQGGDVPKRLWRCPPRTPRRGGHEVTFRRAALHQLCVSGAGKRPQMHGHLWIRRDGNNGVVQLVRTCRDAGRVQRRSPPVPLRQLHDHRVS